MALQDIHTPGGARGVAFMHLPKTAGTSLIFALAAALEVPAHSFGFDLSQFGDATDLDSLGPAQRCLIWPAWRELSREASLLAGHFSLKTLTEAAGERRTMTLLREPASRLLSLWLYWRQTDPGSLEVWGAWDNAVRKAYKPLEEFLNAPEPACQTDNALVRMLLWPDDRIPVGAFIDRGHDDALVADASARLLTFDFLSVVEVPDLQSRLQAWLGRELVMGWRNETARMPASLRSSLDRELTVEACRRLEDLSRLDLALWRNVVRMTLPSVDHTLLRRRVIEANVERHMGPIAVHPISGRFA